MELAQTMVFITAMTIRVETTLCVEMLMTRLSATATQDISLQMKQLVKSVAGTHGDSTALVLVTAQTTPQLATQSPDFAPKTKSTVQVVRVE
jgi:hypothetical protein